MAVHLSWSCDPGRSGIMQSLCDTKHIVLLWLSLRHSVQLELHTGSINKSQVGSRGESGREEKRERQGGGEPGYLQPLLLGFSIIHTPGQLNALGPQLYT